MRPRWPCSPTATGGARRPWSSPRGRWIVSPAGRGPRLERVRQIDELIRTGCETPSGEPEPVDALTPRELDVVRQIALGRTNGEIAAALFISPKTVSVHVSNVLAKLEMSSRTEVAAWAIRTGVAPELAA